MMSKSAISLAVYPKLVTRQAIQSPSSKYPSPSPSPSPSTPPLLPNELLSQIITHALYTPFLAASRSKRAWNAIKGFTLACRRFRDVSLRVWFAQVKLLTYTDWSTYCRIPGTKLFYWMRDLHILEPQNQKHLSVLPLFSHLQCVNYEPNDVDGGQFDTSRLHYVLGLLPPTVLDMTLMPVPAVSCDLIEVIAARFKDLRSLSLGSKRIREPIPMQYPRGSALADAYSKSLQPLQSLRSLHLGLHLIDSTRKSHLSHVPRKSTAPSHSTAITLPGNIPNSPIGETPSWAHECRDCTATVSANEKEAVVRLAISIKTLRKVEWTRWNKSHKSVWVRLVEGAAEEDMWVTKDSRA